MILKLTHILSIFFLFSKINFTIQIIISNYRQVNIDFKQFLIDCDLEDMLYMTNTNTNTNTNDNSALHELNGKTIVLTGTRDKTIIDFLKSVGANQGSSVSKNTHMVIAKDLNDDTGKVETAKKLGIELISVVDFITKYVK